MDVLYGTVRWAQVHVRGANVFKEYWRNEEATEKAFSNGYFRTGDLAVRSPDGYYELRGRTSDLIISGGYNIYPREIEEFLQLQPEIAEAAVVGAPDPVWGEVPVAYVVSTQSFDPADMQLRCKRSFASFKMPRSIHVVEQLPRNAMGKVAKKQLPQSPISATLLPEEKPARQASVRRWRSTDDHLAVKYRQPHFRIRDFHRIDRKDIVRQHHEIR